MRRKAIVFAAALAATGGAAVAGCSTGPETSAADVEEIVENLRQAGYDDAGIAVVNGVVYVEGDLEVSLAASRELLQDDGSTKEQFRVANLVAGPNPAVICVNGAPFVGVMSTGFDQALGNYNVQPIRLRFRRVNGGPVAGCNFFINSMLMAGTGGSAGFPSGGAPFGLIRIGSGLAALGVDAVEHIVTHELGHCIGFAHSDIAVPNACGGPGGGLGAIHIPGTPMGFTPSVMNCTRDPALNGEFTATDLQALNFLY